MMNKCDVDKDWAVVAMRKTIKRLEKDAVVAKTCGDKAEWFRIIDGLVETQTKLGERVAKIESGGTDVSEAMRDVASAQPCRAATNLCHPGDGSCLRCEAEQGELCRE